MHKDKSKKKLTIRGETLRNLSTADLTKVSGGVAVVYNARSLNGPCANSGPLN